MLEGLIAALSPLALGSAALGVLLGIIIGAIPGLTATFGIALLIPVTFLMSPEHGLIMLAGIYAGAIYGGSISAILLNIPGTPASFVSAMEGYPLTRAGKAPQALGLSAVSAGIGSLLSALALMFMAPTLADLALRFGAPEYVMLVILSFIIVVVMLDTPVAGNVAGIFIGLVLASVGLDPVSGAPRFTFGFYQLFSGLNAVAVLIGFFCLPQALVLASEALRGDVSASVGRVGASSPTAVLKRLALEKWLLLRSSAIGIGLGILPAIGPESTPLVAHSVERRLSKEPGTFGKGSESGLVASDASICANVGGSLIPLLALGIPGSGAAAVFIGALTLHGLRPGPLLFTEQGDIVHTFFAGFFLVSLMIMVMGLFGARYLALLLRLPKTSIATFIVLFSIFGAYAVNNSIFDVWVMIGAAGLSIVFAVLRIPLLPVVIAFILGGLLESNLAIAVARADGFGYLLDRPITIGLAIAAAVILMVSGARRIRQRKEHARQDGPVSSFGD